MTFPKKIDLLCADRLGFQYDSLASSFIIRTANQPASQPVSNNNDKNVKMCMLYICIPRRKIGFSLINWKLIFSGAAGK
jgi:hypothetical protein